jgi:hypothetical protein
MDNLIASSTLIFASTNEMLDIVAPQLGAGQICPWTGAARQKKKNFCVDVHCG